MRTQLKILSLICVFMAFGCKSDQKKSTNKVAQITLISPEEAEKLMTLENTQLVDVRTVEEFEEGRIKGAVNLVYQKNFKEEIENLDKSKPVVVYCRSGNRSGKCAEILKKAGFEKIYDLEGGLMQWKREGKPVEE